MGCTQPRPENPSKLRDKNKEKNMAPPSVSHGMTSDPGTVSKINP